MKETGIVRRVDELGRVVLPMELRRTLHISTGDSLEFYVESDRIVLKKYDTVGDVEQLLDNVEKYIKGGNELPLKVHTKLLKKLDEMRKVLEEGSE